MKAAGKPWLPEDGLLDTLLASAILGVVVFAATNIDDVFVLLGFFADREFRLRDVVLGQYIGIVALVGVSMLAASIALVIPRQYVGWLGLIPVALGIKKLRDNWQARNEDDTAQHRSRTSGFGRGLSVAAVTVANGGDNIGVYTPLFVVRSAAEIAVILAVFAIMTGAWCGIANWLVSHRTIGAPIRRYGQTAMPFVLIAIGLWVIYEAGSLQLR